MSGNDRSSCCSVPGALGSPNNQLMMRKRKRTAALVGVTVKVTVKDDDDENYWANLEILVECLCSEDDDNRYRINRNVCIFGTNLNKLHQSWQVDVIM